MSHFSSISIFFLFSFIYSICEFHLLLGGIIWTSYLRTVCHEKIRFVLQGLRNTEISYFHINVIKNYVFRFQVSVENFFLVKLLCPFRDIQTNSQHLFFWHNILHLLNHSIQAASLDQLHYEIMLHFLLILSKVLLAKISMIFIRFGCSILRMTAISISASSTSSKVEQTIVFKAKSYLVILYLAFVIVPKAPLPSCSRISYYSLRSFFGSLI